MNPKMSNITQKWLDLIIPFSNNYSAKMTASALAKETGIPQQTASRHLNRMAELGLLEYSVEGRNKLFFLDLKKQTSRILLNMAESQKAIKFQQNLREVSATINDMLKHCESIVVFGSYASGNFGKESDLDILLLGRTEKEKIKRIKRKQATEINEHYASYSEFSRLLYSGNPLTAEIAKNHVIFGDVSKVVGIFCDACG